MTDTGYIDQLLAEERPAFEVTDDLKADWAVEQIHAHIELRDRLVALADARIKEMQEKKAKYALHCQNETAYLSVKLLDYFHTVKTADTKTQRKYQLTSGTLLLKHQQPEIVRDEAVILAWAKKVAPQYVQVKESVAWGELKKVSEVRGEAVVLKETGEIVQGVVAFERADTFEITL